MARRSFFIEEKRIIRIKIDEEAPARKKRESGSRDKKEAGRPQKILDFIKRYVWPILFAVGASVTGSIIAGFILGG